MMRLSKYCKERWFALLQDLWNPTEVGTETPAPKLGADLRILCKTAKRSGGYLRNNCKLKSDRDYGQSEVW